MKKLILSNSILYFSLGLISPFWIYKITEISGNSTRFSIAMAIMIITQAGYSRLSGNIIKPHREKILYKINLLVMAICIPSFIFTSSFPLVLIIQFIFGALIGINETLVKTLLGNYTKRKNRAYDIGMYEFYVTLSAGLAVALASPIGSPFVFVIGSILILLSSIIIK